MVKVTGGLKRNGKDYKPGGGYGRRKLSTLIARQLVTGMMRPFTSMGPGQGPVEQQLQYTHNAQGGQHKQARAGARGLVGFDDVNRQRKRRK